MSNIQVKYVEPVTTPIYSVKAKCADTPATDWIKASTHENSSKVFIDVAEKFHNKREFMQVCLTATDAREFAEYLIKLADQCEETL
jgi:hypothetical protein